MVAFFDSDVTGWHGVHQAFQVREFAAEGILLSAQNLPPPALAGITLVHGRRLGELMADYNRIVTAGPPITDTGTGRVRNLPALGAQVFYRLTDTDAARLVRGVELTGRRCSRPEPAGCCSPSTARPRSAAPASCAAAGPAGTQGRAAGLLGAPDGHGRMNEDPKRGVTDSFGAFHGVPGLFVADASLFPVRSRSTRWRPSSRWPSATPSGSWAGYRQPATGRPGTYT